MSALLEVRGGSRFFGGLAALTDVDFSIAKGEALGLIGPHGAGKTTMFNVVNGFYQPSRGEVLFKGERISGLKPHQICRRGLARTFQVVRPLQRMSTPRSRRPGTIIAFGFISGDDYGRHGNKVEANHEGAGPAS